VTGNAIGKEIVNAAYRIPAARPGLAGIHLSKRLGVPTSALAWLLNFHVALIKTASHA